MKKARIFSVWGASVVIGAGLLWACSSSTAESGGGTGADKDATTGSDTGALGSGDGGGGTDSGKITPKGDGGGGDSGRVGVCAATTTAADCYNCCDSVASDGGVSEFFGAQAACFCSAKHCDTVATCKNTFCANPDVDDAGVKCNACQDKFLADDAGDAGCEGPIIDECAADPNCAAGLGCVVNDALCNSLP
jgi:hypothetical protein